MLVEKTVRHEPDEEELLVEVRVRHFPDHNEVILNGDTARGVLILRPDITPELMGEIGGAILDAIECTMNPPEEIGH